MGPLDLVNLTPLMERTGGRAEINVGAIDGPVGMNHPDPVGRNTQELRPALSFRCARR
jgi:hypothetical protein